MPNPESDFWRIVGASFPEAAVHRVPADSSMLREYKNRAQEAARREKIEEASKDPAIADCYLQGIGSPEGLVDYLVANHLLSDREEAEAAIVRARRRLSGNMDYGDEA